uniref:C-type lectin domain-containing protein n=1 Tax=Scleropages formosus TaxID=113540 RepID=A0A8C9VD67_SCLFO
KQHCLVTCSVYHNHYLMFLKFNKTWNEALRYCRDNNMELVSVHNADVQKWVEETVKNATSGHVWLGLRYTCVLNFWFWVSAQSIQYEHWAPSNETGFKNTCKIFWKEVGLRNLYQFIPRQWCVYRKRTVA